MDRKEVLRQTGSAAVTAALIIGLWVVGYVTQPIDANTAKILCGVFGGVIVLAAAINMIAFKCLDAKMRALGGREAYDTFQKAKSDIQSDYRAAERRANAAIAFAYLYLFALAACFSALAFFLGNLTPYLPYIVTALIALVEIFLLWGIVHIFFYRHPYSAPTGDVLPRKDFPLLYRTVEAAAKKTGIKKRVVICPFDGISVFVYGGTVYISLNYYMVPDYTSGELYNIMLHEFAHVRSDVKRGHRYDGAESRWDLDKPVNPIISLTRALFLTLVSAKLIMHLELFKGVTSRSYEQLADEAVLTLGDPSVYADALAKTFYHSQFRSAHNRELEYDFFAPEQPTEGYATLTLQTYRKRLETCAAAWREKLFKELPANIDSHPTALMRIRAMGRDDFVPDRAESDEAYAAEMQSLLKYYDAKLYEEITTDGSEFYKNHRREDYLLPTKAMQRYVFAKEHGERLSTPRILSAYIAFCEIEDDRALDVVGDALKEDLLAPRANFCKGVLLSHKGDDGCVECFMTAATHPKWTSECYDRIGKYALESGNEELLKQYRSTAPEKCEQADKQLEAGEYNEKRELMPHGLDSDFIGEFVEDMTDGGRQISRIYIAKYLGDDGKPHYPVYVVPKRGLCYETLGYLHDILEVFCFEYSDKYDFKFVVDERVTKVPGSNVYTAR